MHCKYVSACATYKEIFGEAGIIERANIEVETVDNKACESDFPFPWLFALSVFNKVQRISNVLERQETSKSKVPKNNSPDT